MKTAVVLQADSPSFQRHAGEIDLILKDISTFSLLDDVALWLFYREPQYETGSAGFAGLAESNPPRSETLQIPQFNCNVTAIKQILLGNIYFPESILHALVHLANQDPVDLFCFSSDGLGEELATRLAFRLGGSSCLQVMQVESCRISSSLTVDAKRDVKQIDPQGDAGDQRNDQKNADQTDQKGRINPLAVIKPVYGNNLNAKFLLNAAPYCLSPAKLSGSQIKMVPFEGGMDAPAALEPNRGEYGDKGHAYNWVIDWVVLPPEADTGLSSADLILVVGQGAKEKKTVDQLHRIADTLGAELGASRPVVMNAWTDMNRLVGASGLILSPKCCIAAGVSGTAVFSVGIKNSDFIVAINTNSAAAIFQLADVGIVGDLKAVLTELEQLILAEKLKSF